MAGDQHVLGRQSGLSISKHSLIHQYASTTAHTSTTSLSIIRFINIVIMLSWRHHLLFWGLAAASVVARYTFYTMRPTLYTWIKNPEANFRSA